MHKKRCFIVTDSFLYKNGYTKKIEDKLDQMGIVHTCFYDVEPDPSLASARAGAAAMRMFEPDCIIAMGGGSAMDAGKIMWVLYEIRTPTLMIWLWTLWISVRESSHSRIWVRKLTL